MFSSPFFFTAQKFLASDFANREDYFFARALKNAQFAMGSTQPNPSVGAVLIEGDHMVAEGFTQPAGYAHAEKHVLAYAGKKAHHATLLVTLEPCCHFGKTPPCTDAIIDAGIRRVIFGTVDPNPAVLNKGIDTLRRAGITVNEIGHLELKTLAATHLKPFTTWIKKKRPYVVAKIASSFDQKIGLFNKRTKITNEQSDVVVHQLRRAVDAVMVGKNTVCVDNPMLTARLGQENHKKQPVRVVLSRDLCAIRDEANVYDSSAKTIVITMIQKDRRREEQLLARGVEVFACDVEQEKIDLASALSLLADRGITSLLVEPGQQLFSSLMKKRMPDEVWWFRSKIIMGEGLLVPLEETLMKEGYELHHQQSIGSDELLVFLRDGSSIQLE